MIEELDVAVIGAGFAGLATAAKLNARGVSRFAVFEQGDGVGHFWSQTYDRIQLHSPWHDLPDDGGANAKFAIFKKRDELLDYFRRYALRHALGARLRFGHRVLRAELSGNGTDWRIETTRGEIRARHLAVATAVNRAPHEIEIAGRDDFSGRVLHSAVYRNARDFAGQRVLVVGSGNSASEIALDLAAGGAASVSMWVRGARHFIPLRSMRRVYRLFRALGQFSAARMDARHAITWGTPAFDAAIAPMDKLTNRFSLDLSRFGIRKPDLPPARETFTKGRIPTYDVGTADAILRGQIRVIDGNTRPLEAFEVDGMRIGGDRERFDAVILATGFEPKLEEFIADADRLLGPVRWLKRGALTDGRCRSSVVPSLFFPGFDPTPIGGASLGRWGFEVGGVIADTLQPQS